MTPPRWRCWAGVAGPAAFITAWSTLGASRAGYSPVTDPISRLAAVGEPTRPLMTGGFLAFAAGVSAYSSALRDHGFDAAGRAARVTALATLGIAARPLGRPGGDRAHAVPVAIAYAALAATPVLASRPLARRGARWAAVASMATGVGVAGSLGASVLSPRATGLAQRVGLTLGHLWIMASAVQMLRRGGCGSASGSTRKKRGTCG
jgi:hypothetical protein